MRIKRARGNRRLWGAVWLAVGLVGLVLGTAAAVVNATEGVDLVLTDLFGPTNQFDDDPGDDKVVTSLFTYTTNVGTVEAEWFNPVNESHLGTHPHFWFRFIIQPSDGAPYVVVGQSDIKNGILAANSPPGCNPLVVDSDHLWPGCTDIYSSTINTTQSAFIPLADFNLATGEDDDTHQIPLHEHADTDHLLAQDEGFVLPDGEIGTEGCPAVGFPQCYLQVDIWHTQETGAAILNNAGYMQVAADEALPLLFTQVGAFTQDALVPVDAPLTTATPCVLANPVTTVGPLLGNGGSPAVNAQVTTTFTGNIISTSKNSVDVCAGTTLSWTFGGAGPPPASSTLDDGPDPGSTEVNEHHKLMVTNEPAGSDTDRWNIVPLPCPSTPDTDGDGLGDACDPCPADPDCDGDSLGLGDPFGLFFSDGVEAFTGTNPISPCSATSAEDDEAFDALVTDFDDSQDVDGSDLFLFAERFGTELGMPPPIGKQPYWTRFDIYPTDASLHKIDGSDLFVLATYFGTSCGGP